MEETLTKDHSRGGTQTLTFCQSCGREPGDNECADGHDATPSSSDSGIGRLVTHRRGMRRRAAVVVGRSSNAEGGQTVLEASGREVTTGKVKPADNAGQLLSIPSPLFRLETLANDDEWHAAVSSWLQEHRDDLLVSIGDRRQFALSAIAAGDVDAARSVSLSDSEISWMIMHAHRLNGDAPKAFQAALELDPDTYPDHLLVLIDAIGREPSPAASEALTDHAAGVDRSIFGGDIVRSLVGANRDDIVAGAAQLEQLAGVEISSRISDVLAGRGEIASSLWARVATDAPLAPGDLVGTYGDFPAIADELIDSGRVDPAEAPDLESAYLRGRLDIASVTDEELREIGAFRELARRLYVSGDTDGLMALAGEAPEAEYFVRLEALRSCEIPDDLPDDDTVKAVAASIRSHKAHPNALADHSAWGPLKDFITEADAAAHPEHAAAWQLERALHDLSVWDFDSAHERARSALKWAQDETIRDEALNVMAFVLHQREEDERAIAARA